MEFHTCLRKRLDIIKPSRKLISDLLAARPPINDLSPNVRELIDLLHSRNTSVYLVSGGFKVIHICTRCSTPSPTAP
jgi:phosphoserine phosphatase